MFTLFFLVTQGNKRKENKKKRTKINHTPRVSPNKTEEWNDDGSWNITKVSKKLTPNFAKISTQALPLRSMRWG